jgi:hypothetical protein
MPSEAVSMARTSIATHSFSPLRMNGVSNDVRHPEIDCSHCGAKFRQSRKWKRFCGPRCRYAAWSESNPRQRELSERLVRIESKIDGLIGKE